MLKRQTLRTSVFGFSLGVAAIVLISGTAFASGVGGLSGGTGACADSGDAVGCVADAGGSSGSGASGGTGATVTGDEGGGSPAPTCPNYVPYPQGGPPPAGENPNGAWYENTCAAGVAQGMGTGVTWIVTGQAPPPPPPDPAIVAAQAASQLQLATPTLTFSPAATAFVKFPEWLWIDGTIWRPLTTSATACNAGGCTTVAATAAPDYVTWDTGDGTPPTVCDGPGTPYDLSMPYSEQSTACSHTYVISSIGEPAPDGNPNDAAFQVTATVDWVVTWAGPDGSGGQLPAIKTQGNSTVEVQQIESVIK